MSGSVSTISFQQDMEFLDPCRRHLYGDVFFRFTGMFRRELSDLCEISFAALSDGVELSVDGRGAFFEERVFRFFRFAGLEGAGLFRRLCRKIGTAGMIVKITFSFGRAVKAGVYFQYPVLPSFFRRFEAGKVSERLSRLQQRLQGADLFAGIDLRTSSPPVFSVFFQVPFGSPELPDLFSSICESLTGGGCADFLNRYHSMLSSFSRGQILLSFPLPGPAPPLFKLDYRNVPLPFVYHLIRECAMESSDLRDAVRLAEKMKIKDLSYLGLKFGKTEMVSLKYYIQRCYLAGGSEAALTAYLINRTIPRFSAFAENQDH